jgi:hypothetical protein
MLRIWYVLVCLYRLGDKSTHSFVQSTRVADPIATACQIPTASINTKGRDPSSPPSGERR